MIKTKSQNLGAYDYNDSKTQATNSQGEITNASQIIGQIHNWDNIMNSPTIFEPMSSASIVAKPRILGAEKKGLSSRRNSGKTLVLKPKKNQMFIKREKRQPRYRCKIGNKRQ